MLSITHGAIAVSAASLTFQLGTDNPLALGLALLGSQLPDLDTTISIRSVALPNPCDARVDMVILCILVVNLHYSVTQAEILT